MERHIFDLDFEAENTPQISPENMGGVEASLETLDNAKTWSAKYVPKTTRKAIETPTDMWRFAHDYFTWVNNNPLKRPELIKGGINAGARVAMPVKRPFSWMGFESHLDARGVITSLDKYRRNHKGRYSAFKDVIRRIGRIIRQDKYEGVVTGFYNPAIISADLAAEKEREAQIANDSTLQIEIIEPEKSTLRITRPTDES